MRITRRPSRDLSLEDVAQLYEAVPKLPGALPSFRDYWEDQQLALLALVNAARRKR